MEVGFEGNFPNKEEVSEKLNNYDLGNYSLQYTQEGDAILRFSSENDEKSSEVTTRLESDIPGAKVQRVEFISSVISSELKEKAYVAVIVAIVGIALYIAT